MNFSVVDFSEYGWDNGPTYQWKQELAQDDPSPKQKYQKSIFSAYQEFSPAVLAVVITKLAHKIFGLDCFEALFVSATAFLLTLVVRNLCKEYTFFAKCEEIALDIARKWPQIHATIGIVTAVSIKYFPLICIPLAASVGILAALTYRVRWLSAAAEAHKNRACSDLRP